MFNTNGANLRALWLSLARVVSLSLSFSLSLSLSVVLSLFLSVYHFVFVADLRHHPFSSAFVSSSSFIAWSPSCYMHKDDNDGDLRPRKMAPADTAVKARSDTSVRLSHMLEDFMT
jgi:hypothetical protein